MKSIKYLGPVLLLLVVSAVLAVLPPLDISKCEKLLLQKINAYRIEKGLAKLTDEGSLQRVTKDHLGYIVAQDEMSHFQKDPKKKRLENRLSFFKVPFSYALENLAFTYVGRRINWEGGHLIIQTEEQLAQNLFDIWRNSKVHNENMLDAKISRGCVKISQNKSDGKVYSVMVMAD